MESVLSWQQKLRMSLDWLPYEARPQGYGTSICYDFKFHVLAMMRTHQLLTRVLHRRQKGVEINCILWLVVRCLETLEEKEKVGSPNL